MVTLFLIAHMLWKPDNLDLQTDPTLSSTPPFQRKIFCFLEKCQVLDIKDHGLNIFKSKDFIRPLNSYQPCSAQLLI